MSDDPTEPKLSTTSGAAARRKARAQAVVDAQLEPDTGDWIKDFKRLGRPDTSNPDTVLSWVRKVQATIAWQIVTYPFPSAAQRDCWKRFGAAANGIGATHSKASLEDTIAELRKERDARRAAAGTVVEVATATITKPSTARGAKQVPRVVTLESTADVPDSGRRPD